MQLVQLLRRLQPGSTVPGLPYERARQGNVPRLAPPAGRGADVDGRGAGMTIRRRALSDGPLGGPQPVTTVQRIVRASVAWQPRNGAAVLPIRILVSGETARVVPDLCREIAAKLGYVYGSASCATARAPSSLTLTRPSETGRRTPALTWADLTPGLSRSLLNFGWRTPGLLYEVIYVTPRQQPRRRAEPARPGHRPGAADRGSPGPAGSASPPPPARSPPSVESSGHHASA